MGERERGIPPNLIVIMMAASAAAVAWALLPVEGPPTNDFVLFINFWMKSIHVNGSSSLAGGFSAYTPPYIYLLNFASLIEPWVGTIAAVKLINVPFVISCAWGVGAIVRHTTADRDRGKIAGAVTLVCPTLLLNSFAHGQCDAIFTSFLIWFVYFALRNRPAVACLMFGLAFSFKQQAIFLSPLLLTLILWRRMPIRYLLIVPATYVVMMIPAALAGRPWRELLAIYARQTELNHVLSMNAPNPWWFLNKLVPYDLGVAVGLLVSTAVGLFLVFRSLWMRRDAWSLLLLGTVASALMPYVMPKMASRYFFVADLMTFALALTRPNLWPTAVLVQIGSLVAISSYFFASWGPSGLAFVPMTLAVCLLVYQLMIAGGSSSKSERTTSFETGKQETPGSEPIVR